MTERAPLSLARVGAQPVAQLDAEAPLEPVRALRPAAKPSPAPGRLIKLGARLPPVRTTDHGAPPSPAPADWVAASPRKIEQALARALQRPSGGWYALGSRRRIVKALRKGSLRQDLRGKQYVLWLDGAEVRVAPNACPHMGARLDTASVRDGQLVCPWHGLELGATPRGSWRCHPVHDDGVLLWVQLAEPGQAPTPEPPLPRRPTHFVDGVIELVANCQAQDILGNRLDPWHGVHLHPHGFAELEVTQEQVDGDADHMRLRVAKRIAGPFCIEVDISFHCTSPRCIVMTILAGEGQGSVVETHATPLGPRVDDPAQTPRCAIVEATLASSTRAGFEHAHRVAAWIRPFIRRSALALWKDDLPYAERLYELRSSKRDQDDTQSGER